MKIAGRFTFWGLCRDAISFYCDVLKFTVEKCVTYGDCVHELGIPLQTEHKDLIHHALIVHPSGFKMYMCDSFSLLISKDPISEINTGHLSEKGCREGSALEIYDLSEIEITELYQRLISNHSIVHIPLGKNGNLRLYASVMDKFNVCWNLSCE